MSTVIRNGAIVAAEFTYLVDARARSIPTITEVDVVRSRSLYAKKAGHPVWLHR